MYSITLKNIKGIREMVFPFPEKKGVYVLTGANGCGKTSLLVALCRLGDKLAFTHYRVNTNALAGLKIDAYQNATITYSHDMESVTYSRKGIRWVPNPRTKSNFIGTFPFVNTLFVSTTGMRFFAQDILYARRPTMTPVSANIITPMNQILGTDKFNDLKYITVKGKKGRQRQLHRNNKLYVIKDAAGNFYSELNFSLGERLLLNTLDLLENISPRTLLLIDEVELALHPVAQIRFYDYLKKQASSKNLAVVISTHSSSLIKHADTRIYLEKDSYGKVSILTDCFPAYILRTVASDEDRRPDFIFFVEDIMAQRYLNAFIRKFLADVKRLIDYKVICVGGYEQVVTLVQSFPALNYEKSKVQAFLDKDVEDLHNQWEIKGTGRTDKENKMLKLFQDNKDNVSYLSITPELGIWEWIEQHPDILKVHIDQQHGVQGFDVVNVVSETTTAEQPNKGGNLRIWAKGCFKNFKERIHQANPLILEEDVVGDMISCYVDNHYNLDRLKKIFFPLFNR